MTISDETLSAFYDGELSEAEMQAVRQALADDPQLAARLAELAMLDQRLDAHFDAINHLPLPPGAAALLDQAEAAQPRGTNIVAFPAWRRILGEAPRQAAAVAGLALVAGFILARLLTPGAAFDDWASIQQALETQASGTVRDLTGEVTVEPRLSFLDQANRYCRQYRLTAQSTHSDDVACRTADGWELVARLPAAAQDGYAPASVSPALDGLLDGMIVGEPLGPEQEGPLLGRWPAPR